MATFLLLQPTTRGNHLDVGPYSFPPFRLRIVEGIVSTSVLFLLSLLPSHAGPHPLTQSHQDGGETGRGDDNYCYVNDDDDDESNIKRRRRDKGVDDDGSSRGRGERCAKHEYKK